MSCLTQYEKGFEVATRNFSFDLFAGVFFVVAGFLECVENKVFTSLFESSELDGGAIPRCATWSTVELDRIMSERLSELVYLVSLGVGDS